MKTVSAKKDLNIKLVESKSQMNKYYYIASHVNETDKIDKWHTRGSLHIKTINIT